MKMDRLGISEISTRNWTLEQDLENYLKHGVKYIGLWNFKFEGKSASEVSKLVNRSGMHVSNVCFAGLFTGESVEERKAAVDNAKRMVDFTKGVNGGCLLLVSGQVRSHYLRHAVDMVRDGLEQVTRYAEDQQVHLGLEALHPLELTQWSVINSVSLAMKLIEKINSCYLGIFLDTYNNGWDPELNEVIPRMCGKIKGVHLADWRNPTRTFTDRTLPGRGVVPIKDIIQMTELSGYTGPYELELFSDELWESDYHDMIREFKEWYSRVEIEVKA